MIDDIRYSELLFLSAKAKGDANFEYFFPHETGTQNKAVGLASWTYIEMVAALVEDLFVRFDDENYHLLVGLLRGEVDRKHPMLTTLYNHYLWDPRGAIIQILNTTGGIKLRITYRGLRRIQELRELLKRDRILEEFGILLSSQYVNADLRDALNRASDTAVSVLYSDMDHFKPINDTYGHDAGDAVMKAYLQAVRDALGVHGTGYRGRGDEVWSIVVGQSHDFAIQIAERIRAAVQALQVVHKEKQLPAVSASIGVATTPPETRSMEIEHIAESRNGQAKKEGRNRIIAK